MGGKTRKTTAKMVPEGNCSEGSQAHERKLEYAEKKDERV